jgi:hypothetical protein
MIYDPHDPNKFVAKNLSEDEWHEYQHDRETRDLVESIKPITNMGTFAVVDKEILYKIGLNVAMKSGIHAVIIPFHDHAFWAALAVSMIGRFAFYEGECFRFRETPFMNEPLYYNNIDWVILPNERWYTARLHETKDIRTAGNRQNDDSLGISTTRVRKQDEPAQGSLFDFH